MKMRHYTFAIIGVMLGYAIAAPGARADTFTYSSLRRQVKVGIAASKALEVFENGASLGSENPDPHVFYVLESRSDLKPAGLEFVNPFAPTVITSDIFKRWKDRQKAGFPDPAFGNGPESRQFRPGNTVTKNMGCYWEVNIDNLSQDDLKQYDLIFITAHVRNAIFSRDVLAKLLKYLEGGGTLWIENCGRFSFAKDAPFLFDFQFATVYGTVGPSPSAAVMATPNHPLLTYPFLIRPEQLQSLGDKNVQGFYIYNPYDPLDPAYYGGDANNNGTGKDQLNPPASHALVPVVWNNLGQGPIVAGGVQKPNPAWRPYVMAGIVGAGKIVITAQDSGCAINDYVGGVNVGYGGNSGAISGEVFLGAKPVDLQFVYNLASWAGSHTTANANAHHNGGSQEKIGGVLVDKWAPAPFVSATPARVGGPVLYKNAIFAVDGNLVLHCYDSKPGEDLDGDRNPDEGIVDYIAGTPYDEIWNLPLAPLGTGLAKGASTPTIVEFFDPEFINQAGNTSPSTTGSSTLANLKQRELVVVELSDGTIIGVRAFPHLSVPGLPLAPDTRVEWVVKLFEGFPIVQRVAAGDPDTAQDSPIPSPTWSEGVLFASVNVTTNGQPSGRIVAIDPRDGLSAMNPGPIGYTGDTADKAAVPEPPAGQPGIPPLTSAPTVAYIRDEGNGAVDKMIYVNVAPPAAGGPAQPSSVRSFQFSTKGEVLTRVNQTTWQSRAGTPWYLFDPANQPLHTNSALRQRVYHTFRDPDGTYATHEFLYTAAAAPGPGEYALVQNVPNQPVRVILPNTVQTPKGNIATDDERNTYYCDYALDWSPPVGQTPITQRSQLPTPNTPSGAAMLIGSPSVAPNDMTYYNAATANSAAVPGRGTLIAAIEQPATRSRVRWSYAMHDGFQMTVNSQPVTIPPRLRQMDPNLPDYGSYLRKVQFIGSPVYKDNVVYAAARGETDPNGTLVSLICAFKADQEFIIRLNTKIDAGTQVQIWQPDVFNFANGSPDHINWNSGQNSNQLTIDYDSGFIRINSMTAPSGSPQRPFSASVPFVVKIGNGPEQVIAGEQVDVLPTGREVRAIGPPAVDNLLWYAVIPANGAPLAGLGAYGSISSSLIAQGDLLWMGFQSGAIGSFSTELDPAFQATGNQVPIKVRPNTAGGNLWVKQISVGGVLNSIVEPPVATQNVLAAATSNGVLALEDTFTLVADNKRLIEVNAGGEAVWTTDSTRSFGFAGGDPPIYIYDEATGNVIVGNPKNGTGVPAVQNVPLSRPTVARRFGSNNILVADTGNNRIVMLDRGSNVIWEVNRLFDDFQRKLRPGDPTTLNEPTDIEYWQEFVNNINLAINQDGTTYTFSGPGYIVHYLIADTGNFRVIELVDVYDIYGNPVRPTAGATAAPFVMLRQVNFVTNSFAVQGKKYRYRSVQRIAVRNGDLGQFKNTNLPDDSFRQLTLASISNERAVGNPKTAVNAGGDVAESGGGSLVLLDENGDPLAVISGLRIPSKFDAMGNPTDYMLQPIQNPTWFSKFDEVTFDMNGRPHPTFKYLLCDDNGCYQLKAGVSPTDLDVEWMLSGEDYYRMTGKRLRAAGIKRLSTAVTGGPNIGLHRYLIANRFSGEDNPAFFGITYNATNIAANGNIAGPSAFHGEVFELDPIAFDWGKPSHGYIPDYGVNANMLIANPAASIVWRSPTEDIPTPNVAVGFLFRHIGDPKKATASSLLEQPAFADRPF